MIYLLKSYGPGKEIYKVGYAGDIEKRYNQYYVSNPYIELIDSRPGEIIDEEILHAWLHTRGDLGFLMNEWYIGESVVSYFRAVDLRAIREDLWELRGNTEFTFRVWDNIYSELKGYEDLEDIDRPYIEKSGLRWCKYYYQVPECYRAEYYKFWSTAEEERLGLYCKFFHAHPELISDYIYLPAEYYKLYTTLGYDYIEKEDFNEERLRGVSEEFESRICARVYESFEIGREYRESEIKEILGDVFSVFGIHRKVRGDDILEYFTTSIVTFEDTGRLEFGHYIKARKKK